MHLCWIVAVVLRRSEADPNIGNIDSDRTESKHLLHMKNVRKRDTCQLNLSISLIDALKLD